MLPQHDTSGITNQANINLILMPRDTDKGFAKKTSKTMKHDERSKRELAELHKLRQEDN